MKRYNQSGIALIESLLIILIIAIIGFGGYYVYHSQKQTDNTLNGAKSVNANVSNQIKASDPYAGWKAYTDPSKKWSVRYPSDWIVTTGSGATSPEYIDGLGLGPKNNELLISLSSFRSTQSAKDLLNSDNQSTVFSNQKTLTINGNSAYYEEDGDGNTYTYDTYGIVGKGIGININMIKTSTSPPPSVDNTQYENQFNLIAKSVRIL